LTPEFAETCAVCGPTALKLTGQYSKKPVCVSLKKKRRGAPQGRNGPLPTAQCGLMTPLRSPEGHGHPTGALRPRLGEWRFRFFFFFALPGMCSKTKKRIAPLNRLV